ncbi:MAG: hypothetical protein KA007_00055 [Candidatus Pacebacteria bacterium]|nr:hypothetical protein [Candidatus Paceibacterota bacterium]
MSISTYIITRFREIQKLKEQFSSDEEFGREVRKYLDTPYQSYSEIQLDYIGEGGIKEVETEEDIIAYRRYFIRDNKLYMTNDHTKILPDENYCYITSSGDKFDISKIIKNSKDTWIAIESTRVVKDKKGFTPEKLKQYLEKK